MNSVITAAPEEGSNINELEKKREIEGRVKAVSLPEAILFVELNVRRATNGHIPLVQPAVVRMLRRDGSDVPIHGFAEKGMQTEVVLFSVLMISLVYFDHCNAIIVTTSKKPARSFFEKCLFTANGPKGNEFARLCGKTLKPKNPTELGTALFFIRK